MEEERLNCALRAGCKLVRRYVERIFRLWSKISATVNLVNVIYVLCPLGETGIIKYNAYYVALLRSG